MLNRKIFKDGNSMVIMVTQYDVFETVYAYKHPIKPIEIVKRLKKSEQEYDNIYRLLTELVEEKLLTKTHYGFQAAKTEKTQLLYEIISHCLQNDISYNQLLNPNLAEFLSKALQKKEITSQDVKLHPRTLRKYIDILSKYGLLLIISEKPLRAKAFYNVLLNNLLVYFGYKHSVVTEDTADYLQDIERELVRFRRLKKDNESKYQEIINEFEISFVHHSLALEGNPITLNETRIILKDKVIPANLRSEDVDEVKNYQKAILQMLKDSQDKNPLTLQTILGYHALAMQHRPEIAGKIRTREVHIRGNLNFTITRAENVEKELNVLLEKYNTFIQEKKASLKEILEFAVYFHNEFQHIHPFEDGNSRTTRLITFHLLQSKYIPILDIPFGLLDEYMNYTKGSKKREDKKLSQNLQKIVLYNLKKINEKLT